MFYVMVCMFDCFYCGDCFCSVFIEFNGLGLVIVKVIMVLYWGMVVVECL